MATTEKMTIHKGLAELKILDDRIKRAIEDAVFCQVNIEKNKEIEGLSIEDYENKIIRASFDKVTDLDNRRMAIKTAINQSNAVTKINIGDKEYTVAVAIWLKQYGMETKREKLNTMRTQFSLCRKKADKHNELRAEKAEKYVLELYSTKDKVDSKEITEEKNKHVAANTMKILDPVGIQKQIELLENEISEFMANIDAALSVSNAITEIEISY